MDDTPRLADDAVLALIESRLSRDSAASRYAEYALLSGGRPVLGPSDLELALSLISRAAAVVAGGFEAASGRAELQSAFDGLKPPEWRLGHVWLICEGLVPGNRERPPAVEGEPFRLLLCGAADPIAEGLRLLQLADYDLADLDVSTLRRLVEEAASPPQMWGATRLAEALFAAVGLPRKEREVKDMLVNYRRQRRVAWVGLVCATLLSGCPPPLPRFERCYEKRASLEFETDADALEELKKLENLFREKLNASSFESALGQVRADSGTPLGLAQKLYQVAGRKEAGWLQEAFKLASQRYGWEAPSWKK